MTTDRTVQEGLAEAIPIVGSVDEINTGRRAWLVDVWGVMHNGVRPFQHAVAACERFRAAGGIVVLVTNAPRPAASVVVQLERIGVPRAAYDAIVTSGDVTRGLIAAWRDRNIHHLGPERDLPLFSDLGKAFCAAEDAHIVVCTGLRDDERESPDDYGDLLRGFREKNAAMICANPDRQVERGDRIVYCAGALADAYAALGGEVIYAGKPYAPIYELARGIVDDIAGRPVATTEILAIGDGVHTDIAGAAEAGLDAVYIASGIHLSADAMSAEALAALFKGTPGRPIAALKRLG